MTAEVAIAAAGVALVVLGQTGALFYWGGKVKAMLTAVQAHNDKQDEEISILRHRYHAEIAPAVTHAGAVLEMLSDDVKELRSLMRERRA